MALPKAISKRSSGAVFALDGDHMPAGVEDTTSSA